MGFFKEIFVKVTKTGKLVNITNLDKEHYESFLECTTKIKVAYIAALERRGDVPTMLSNCNIPNVNARFPEKEELENECTEYMDSVIKETDYRDRPIHLKHAFKAGVNYLNEFLNGR